MKNIDLYGSKHDLVFQGESKFKTCLGGFLTCLAGVTLITISFIFGMDFWLRINPKVISQETMPETSAFVRPASHNFTIMYRLENESGVTIPEEGSLLFIDPYFEHYKRDSQGTWQLVADVHLDYKFCSETKATENPHLPEVNMKDYFCFDWEDAEAKLNKKREAKGESTDYQIEIGGSWDESEVKFLWFDVNNYKKTDQGKNTPLGNYDDLVEWMAAKEPNFSIFYPAYYFNAEDKEEPFRHYFQQFFYKMSPTLMKKDRNFFKMASLEDDTGWITASTTTFSAAAQAYSQTEVSLIDRPKEEFGEVQCYTYLLYFDRRQISYKRSYMKIQELGALVGGFMKLVQITFGLVGGHFGKFSKYFVIARKLNSKKVILNPSVEQTASKTINNFMGDKTVGAVPNLSYWKYLFSCGSRDKQLSSFNKLKKEIDSRLDILQLMGYEERINKLENNVQRREGTLVTKT